MKRLINSFLAIMCLTAFLTACGGNASSNASNTAAEQPMPVGALMTEYKKEKQRR